MSERVRCSTTSAHVATRRRASRGGLARLVQPRHLHSMSALVPTDLPHTLPRNRLGSSQPIYKRAPVHHFFIHPLFRFHIHQALLLHPHHTETIHPSIFIKHRQERSMMKRPREEELAVSLALSLSTTTDSSSPASSASSTGGAPSSSPSAAKRRRRGPVVATSGEGDFVCKTCGRAFPTFQALGGHRTSHLRGRGHGLYLDLGVVGAKALKQHKAAAAETGANNKPGSGRLMKHECHICGLGFEMGQALGGHMRRHREEMATGGAADDWVWRTQERVVVAAAAAETPVLLELFA